MTTPTVELLHRHVEAGTVPGAVALLGSDDPEIVAAGTAAADGTPMRTDAIVRIQSMTKAVTTVAALQLVEAGLIGLDQSVEEWLPELADRRVLTTPTAAMDDTVSAEGPITLRHLLTNGSGYGMVFVSSPLQEAMAANGTEVSAEPVSLGADEWLARLAELPLAFSELVSTAADYHHFLRMLVAGGKAGEASIISADHIDQMTSDQVPGANKTADSFAPGFWNEMGWGFGVGVQTAGRLQGRYGWSGGQGTDLSSTLTAR